MRKLVLAAIGASAVAVFTTGSTLSEAPAGRSGSDGSRRLTAFNSCGDLVRYAKRHALRLTGPYGLAGGGSGLAVPAVGAEEETRRRRRRRIPPRRSRTCRKPASTSRTSSRQRAESSSSSPRARSRRWTRAAPTAPGRLAAARDGWSSQAPPRRGPAARDRRRWLLGRTAPRGRDRPDSARPDDDAHGGRRLRPGGDADRGDPDRRRLVRRRARDGWNVRSSSPRSPAASSSQRRRRRRLMSARPRRRTATRSAPRGWQTGCPGIGSALPARDTFRGAPARPLHRGEPPADVLRPRRC